MAPPRYLPSTSILVKWVREEGLTHQQCADRVERESGVRVSRASISAALSKAGETNRVRYDDVIPWKVRVEHSHHHLLNMLRLAGRASRGEQLEGRDAKNLESFTRRLDEAGAVVAYVPETDEGWFLVNRRPTDTGLIRIP